MLRINKLSNEEKLCTCNKLLETEGYFSNSEYVDEIKSIVEFHLYLNPWSLVV